MAVLIPTDGFLISVTNANTSVKQGAGNAANGLAGLVAGYVLRFAGNVPPLWRSTPLPPGLMTRDKWAAHFAAVQAGPGNRGNATAQLLAVLVKRYWRDPA